MAEDKLETSSGAGTRRIRSFVRREGRMTDGQREALESLSPRYSLDHMVGTLDFAQAFGALHQSHSRLVLATARHCSVARQRVRTSITWGLKSIVPASDA